MQHIFEQSRYKDLDYFDIKFLFDLTFADDCGNSPNSQIKYCLSEANSAALILMR